MGTNPLTRRSKCSNSIAPVLKVAREGRKGGEPYFAFAIERRLWRENQTLSIRFLNAHFPPTARVAAGFRLDRAGGARWLAIGDAASVFDPLAAQGIHKALADGLDGAALIAKALACDGELGPERDRALDASFEEYLIARNHFYGLERRWPASEFWRRRQARRALATAA